MFSILNGADQGKLVRGGQRYWTFLFSKGSLAKPYVKCQYWRTAHSDIFDV